MRPHKSTASALVVFALALLTNASTAWADFITTFTATGPNGLSASVTFEVSGGNLIITLTNTSSMDVWAPNEVLSGIWFSLPGGLTPVSANVASGSSVNFEPDAGNDVFPDVGGEWAYMSGLNMDWGSNSGINSTGMDDLFGASDLFGGDNLAGPEAPDGIQYGITSDGDDPDNSNGGLEEMPLIQNSVVFILSGWDEDWTASDITNIFFQYGTSQEDTRLTPVPEPGVLMLLGVGFLGMVFAVRKMSWA
jgi:hypothetical protein